MPFQGKSCGTLPLRKTPVFFLCFFLSSTACGTQRVSALNRVSPFVRLSSALQKAGVSANDFFVSSETAVKNPRPDFSAEHFRGPKVRIKTANLSAKKNRRSSVGVKKDGPAGRKNRFRDTSGYLQVQADSFYLKGARAFSLGEKHKGIGFFKQAVLYDPRSIRLRQRLAESYTAVGLWAEAVAQYEALLKEAPALHFVRRRLAEIYALNDLTRSADEHYKVLLSAVPESFPLLSQYARFLAQTGEWLKALEVLKTTREKAPGVNQKVEILLTESFIYGLLGFPRRQKSLLALARAEEPYREDLVLKIARRYVRFGETARAVSLLKDYHSRNSHSVETARALADLFTALNQKTETRRWLLKLRELGELDFKRHFYLSALFSEQGDYRRAADLLQDLLTRSFLRADSARYLLGAVYEKQGELQSALREYGNIPSHSAYFARARIQQAQILQNQGRDSKALNLLKPVIFARQNGPRALLLYTQLLWKKRKKQQTLTVLTEGLKHFPQNRDILFLRGACFSKTGDIQNALRDMEQILANNSKDGEVLHFLADLHIKKNDLSRGEALARKALALRPDSGSLLNTLGLAFFQKGKWGPALKYLSRAFYLNNRSGPIAGYLGEIYYQMNDLEKSRFFFEKAALLESDGKKRKALQKRARALQAEI